MTAARKIAPFVLAIAAACSRRPDVPIVTFHSVSTATDGFTVAEETFTKTLDALRGRGFHTVTFHDWLAHEDQKAALPVDPIILTFDDGYQDAYTTVLPALRAREMKAAFFVVTSFVGHDEAHRVVRQEEGTARRYLIWPEVRALAAAGMEIGSHGLTHRRLLDLNADEARRELKDSKEQLEAVLGRPVEIFAYPYNSVRRW
ncbi:MAG TPA: polysaccharide deacetylase family protein, partial [Myxococcales bacterium]|nr:polysaccharide deacetylase family protein [Myxococcales bacterium]